MKRTLLILLCFCFGVYAQSSEDLYQVGQYTKAIEAFKAIEQPTSADKIILAKSFCAKGMTKDCLYMYKEALVEVETEAFLIAKFNYAKLLQSQKRLKEADSLYSILLSVMPDNAEFLYQRGRVGEALKSKAFHQYFLDALSVDSTHIKAAYEATEYFIKVENYELAKQIATKTLQNVPDTPRLVNLLAQVNYRQEKWTESLKYINRLEILKSDLPKFIFEMKGNNYLKLQNPMAAADAFQKAFKLDNKDPQLCLKLGELYLTLEEPKKAMPYLHNYRYLRDTSMWEYNYQMGNYFMQTKGYQMAFRYYDLCHKENVHHEASQYYRAVAADNFMKDKSKVLDYYTNYLETWESEKDTQYKNLATRRATDIRKELFMEE